MNRTSLALAIVIVAVCARSSIAATIATDAPAIAAQATASHEDAPHDIMFGRFLYEPYTVSGDSEQRYGGRFGVDMLAANGDGNTKVAGGMRFTLGGDGAAAFGTEGQLLIGVVHSIRDRAAVALVAPLGFTLGGGRDHFAPGGYAGIEGVAAIGKFAREQGPTVKGVEIAAGVSNRGMRARLGVVRPGDEVGLGFGIDWQRDGDFELVGVYVATTPGRR